MELQMTDINDKYSDGKEELSETGEPVGIEADYDEEELEPFDPNEISIHQKVVSMDVIIRRLAQNSIKLSPSFQRREVWDVTRKSRLIESIMLNIPLPMFYVAADEKGNWEVVDGLQRLSTIRDFMIPNSKGERLKLKNLEFLGSRYDNKSFDEIENDASEQRLVNSIYETEMRFTVINPGTPESVKRNIFKRLNTGGMPLTSQEIRHALYEGISSNLLQELVASDSFVEAIGKRINDSRMSASELVLRLVSFMIQDRKNYKPGMDTWLSNAMRILNCFPSPTDEQLKRIYAREDVPEILITDINEIKRKFHLAMNRGREFFDGHAFRKSLNGEERKSPVNKSLFEVWGNILAVMPEQKFEALKERKFDFIKGYKKLLSDNEFNNAISRHSSTTKGIVFSYSELMNLIDITLHGGDSDRFY